MTRAQKITLGEMREQGVYLKFTEAGAALFA